jgi:uncharacterized ion transporter superfamily protein YfcC
MIDVWTVFNQTGSFGIIIDSLTQHWTGSLHTTLIIILMCLLLVASFFHMPEILIIVPLIPVLLIFSTIDPGLQIVVALLSLFLGYILYSILPFR